MLKSPLMIILFSLAVEDRKQKILESPEEKIEDIQVVYKLKCSFDHNHLKGAIAPWRDHLALKCPIINVDKK